LLTAHFGKINDDDNNDDDDDDDDTRFSQLIDSPPLDLYSRD